MEQQNNQTEWIREFIVNQLQPNLKSIVDRAITYAKAFPPETTDITVLDEIHVAVPYAQYLIMTSACNIIAKIDWS